MKKFLFTLIIVFALTSAKAQTESIDTSKVVYNKWTVEVNIGQSKGIKPYHENYFSSNPDKFWGRVQLNNFGLGARYMFSPKFGFKFDLNYDKLDNDKNTSSLPFEMIQYRAGLQGVVNLIRLFDIQEPSGRFGLLAHGGIQISQMKSKTKDVIGEESHNYNQTEYNGGLILGLTPQFRIAKNIAIVADFSVLNNYRQHYNWDGSYQENRNNLTGQLVTTTLGLSYSFGKGKMHGDWAVIQDKNEAKINELNGRVAAVEAAAIANTPADLNKNNIPDNIETYITNTYGDMGKAPDAGEDIAKYLINNKFVAVYFDFDKDVPTVVSNEAIDFILTYLRNNPSTSIDINGYTDELGSTEYNNKLAIDRANTVKNILVKANIASSRLNAINAGEDNSVDKTSEEARKLVRRVTFEVK